MTIRQKTTLAALLAAATLTIGCGSDSPAAPTPPPIAQYAGNWRGTYTITGCTQSGGVGLANVCGSLGNSPAYTFSLSQSGSSVTGSFTLGSIGFPSTGGTVGSDGSLQLQATSLSNGVTIIVTWHLTNPGNSIGGTIVQNWTSTTLSGQANVTGSISTAARTSVVTSGVTVTSLGAALSRIRE
jgi:hypothetical protein